MSRFTDVQCHNCGTLFKKANKELNRRKRLGKTEMFCGMKCASIKTKHNLPDTVSSPEHMSKMASKAAEANRRYYGEDAIFQPYIRRAQQRKKWSCDLTIQYLQDLWLRQNGRCAVSNIPLEHAVLTTDHNVMASLDRIDSTLGYIQGNVQFLSCALNWAKWQRSDDSLRALLSLIVDNSCITTFNDVNKSSHC